MSTTKMELIMDVTARAKEPIIEKTPENISSLADSPINDTELRTIETIEKSNESYKQNTAILGEFGDVLPAIIRNLTVMNMQLEKNHSLLPAKSVNNLLKTK
jgi:hypothetical protein